MGTYCNYGDISYPTHGKDLKPGIGGAVRLVDVGVVATVVSLSLIEP